MVFVMRFTQNNQSSLNCLFYVNRSGRWTCSTVELLTSLINVSGAVEHTVETIHLDIDLHLEFYANWINASCSIVCARVCLFMCVCVCVCETVCLMSKCMATL